MKQNEIKKSPAFVIYETDNNVAKVSVRLEEETVWLTQAHLVELFQSSKANISEHIRHIFEEGALDENSVVRKFRTTAADGKNYQTAHYNNAPVWNDETQKKIAGQARNLPKQLTQKSGDSGKE